MPADDTPLAYTIAEAADELRCSRDTVERLIAAGRLASVALGPRRKVIPRTALVKFLEDEAA